METVLRSRQLNHAAGIWLIAPAVILLGLALGALGAAVPHVGLGIATVPLLAVLILPRPRLGLYIIAASLPFEGIMAVGSSFTAIKFVGIITFVAWLIELKRTKRTFVRLGDQTSLILFFFLAIAALSITQARNLTAGAVELVTLIQLVGLYFMTIDLTHDKQTFNRILFVLVLTGIPAALIAFVEFWLTSGSRFVGVYSDPNHSALNLLFLIPLTLAFANRHQSSKKWMYYAAFIVLGLGTLVLQSRGAMVALLVMLFLISREHLLEPRLKKAVKIILFIFVVAVALVALVDPRFSIVAMIRSGGSGRLDIWKTGWYMFIDHPLVGIGLLNFKHLYLEYATRMPWIDPGVVKTLHAHNMYVEVAVETGLFGLTSFLTFLTLTLVRLYRAKQVYRQKNNLDHAVNCAMLMLSLVSFLIGVVFLDALLKKALWLLLGLAAGQTYRISRRSRLEQITGSNHE